MPLKSIKINNIMEVYGYMYPNACNLDNFFAMFFVNLI